MQRSNPTPDDTAARRQDLQIALANLAGWVSGAGTAAIKLETLLEGFINSADPEIRKHHRMMTELRPALLQLADQLKRMGNIVDPAGHAKTPGN